MFPGMNTVWKNYQSTELFALEKLLELLALKLKGKILQKLIWLMLPLLIHTHSHIHTQNANFGLEGTHSKFKEARAG